MIVFHGTTEIIKEPDVLHSKRYLDFGQGFYLTSYEEQAKKWAIRKGIEVRKAFDIYYSSRLARQIADGSYGIENMDARYLAEDLIENEVELFA